MSIWSLVQDGWSLPDSLFDIVRAGKGNKVGQNQPATCRCDRRQRQVGQIMAGDHQSRSQSTGGNPGTLGGHYSQRGGRRNADSTQGGQREYF